MTPRRLLTLTEAAAEFRWPNRVALWKFCRRYGAPVRRHGDRLLLDAREFELFLEQLGKVRVRVTQQARQLRQPVDVRRDERAFGGDEIAEQADAIGGFVQVEHGAHVTASHVPDGVGTSDKAVR